MKFVEFPEDTSMFDWYDTAQGFYILRKAIIYTVDLCSRLENPITDREIESFTDVLHGLSNLVKCIEMFRPAWPDSFDPVLINDINDYLDLLAPEGGEG